MIVTIAGVEYDFTPNDEQLSRISLEFAAFDGEVGFGTFPLPDPGESILPVTGRQFRVDEIDTLLTDGFVLDWDRQRGPFRVGAQREYNLSPMDANALLGGFLAIITRSSETDRARMLAFAAQYRPTWDTTWVLNTNTVTMPAKKYDSDQGFGELIADLVEFTGKTTFVHDKALGGRCLHYHSFTEGHTCGLSINDDPAVQNGTTVFAPMLSPIFTRTSVDLRNVVRGRDQAGRVSQQSDPTSTGTHNVDGLYHQSIIDFETTSAADLSVKTAAYLATSKNDYDTRSVGIGPLDATALALIRVGDLISVDSAVLALTGDYKRIAHMTLTPWGNNPAPDLWLATLELEQPIRRRARVKAVALPLPPPAPFDPGGPCIPTLSNACVADIAWAEDSSSGDMTITPVGPGVDFDVEGTSGGGVASLTATPWALDETDFTVSFYVTFNSAAMRNEESGVTDVYISVASGGTYGVRISLHLENEQGEFAVGIGNTETVHNIDWVYGTTYGIVFEYATGGTSTVRLNGEGDSGTTPVGTVAVTATVSELYDEGNIEVTADTDTFCLLCDAPTPYTGQSFIEIIGTGDGTTTQFTTMYPFVSLSLKVYVDDLREFAFGADASTGEIEFDVAPGTGEVIRAEYVAA